MANWKGTAVPNNGVYQTIYINTALSTEEVVNILEKLNFISLSDFETYSVMSVDYASTGGNEGVNYPELTVFRTEGQLMIIAGYNPIFDSTVGWYDGIETSLINTREGITFLNATYSDEGLIPVGDQNDKISSLFSITPFTQDEPITSLPEFLTGIADAIRKKKGTTEKINAQDFSSEIMSIEGGCPEWDGDYSEEGELPKPEGTLEITENGEYDVINYSIAKVNIEASSDGGEVGEGYKVRYFDIDGAVLKTEYVSNGGKLTPPNNPNYDSDYLIFDEWNYDIENYIVEQPTDIDAIYRTKTGDTYLFIKLAESIGLTIPTMGISGATSIDWGDGTIDTNLTHTYTDYGEYIIKISGITSIITYLFGSSSSVYNCCLKKCYLGNSVTSIGDNAFYGCYSLTSVTIPNSVTNIGSSAFRNCYSLTSITIPNSVTNIVNNAFYCCYALTSITIPNGVTSIGSDAFRNCFCLTSVTIPNSVTSIGDNAFYYCYSLTSITIPNSVTSIGKNAFFSCYSLTSVTIPNSVTNIGNSAFYYCYSLTSVTIPNSVTNIGNSAFYYCYSLTSVTISNSVTSIVDSTFYNCFCLTSVIIPNSVTSVGKNAFYCCYAIINYIFNCNSVPTLSNTNAFININKSATIWVKDELVDAYKSATNWSIYASYIKPLSAMSEKLKEELGVL